MATFTPLTPQQFQAAQNAGFTTDQIISNEKIRQSQSGQTKSPSGLGAYVQTTDLPQIWDALKSGAGQTWQGIQDVANSGNPLSFTEGLLKTTGGIVNTVSSPLSPIFKPVEDAVQNTGEALSNTPLIKESADTPTGQTVSRGLEDVNNLMTTLGGILGVKSMLEHPTSGESIVEKPTVPPEMSEGTKMTIQSRVDTYNQLAEKSTAVQDAIEAGKAKGFDPVADLASDDRFTPEINKDGRIDSSVAIKKLNDFVKPIAQVERQAIVAEGRSYSFDAFANAVKKSLNQYKARGASYQTMLNRVTSDLEVYREEYAPNGTISGVNLDDIKNAKYQIANWDNEDAQISDKTVARAAKDMIYGGTKNADLIKLNSEMSRYYSARDVLDSVDNKIVRGGRLGKYFARTIGTAVGSHFGPLGAIAGMYTGDALESAAMQHKFNPIFGGILGKEDLTTPTPQSVANTTQMLNLPKLALPSPK
jgi:hypothetical protein